MINICKDYVRNVIRPTEVGLIEFGIYGRWHNDKLISSQEYNSGTWEKVQFDAILVDCHKRYVRGFEFKVSRSDFLQDKKWKKYLKYCSSFSFVCPPDIIKKSEVEKGIGLVYVSAGDCTKWPAIQWIQRPRSRPMEDIVYIRVITSMLLRAKTRRDEIF